MSKNLLEAQPIDSRIKIGNKWYDCKVIGVSYKDGDRERFVFVDIQLMGIPMETVDHKSYRQIMQAVYKQEELDNLQIKT